MRSSPFLFAFLLSLAAPSFSQSLSEADFSARLGEARRAALEKPADVYDRYPDMPATRRAEGIGISHSGDPFDIPNFSLPQIAEMIKASGGTYYRPHLPLNLVLPSISKEQMDKLRLAQKDSAVLDEMTASLSREANWSRMDALVDAFTSRGVKVILVTGGGYRKEAPLYEGKNGREAISPDRLGRDLYVTAVKWIVGAGVRRYARKVEVWQVENEINVAAVHSLGNWRTHELSWADKKFHYRLLTELSAVVHNEGARQGVSLKTTQNYATQSAIGWEDYIRDARSCGIDVVGIDIYGNYLMGWPLLDEKAGEQIAAAKKAAGGLPVWVLEAGYSRAPAVRGFTPQRQTEYFKRFFDRAFRNGADVVLAFGWFWNPSGWFTDNGQPQWYEPMAAEPYWSPIEIRQDAQAGAGIIYHGAWDEFHKAAVKWTGAK